MSLGLSAGRIPALVLAISVLCLFDVGGAQELPPEVPAAVGLNGILPDSMPDDVAEAIDALPESWKDWGDSLRTDLNSLHTGEDKSIEDQRARIGSLRQRAKVAYDRGTDPAYAQARILLLTLAGRLNRWLDLIEAALDTLTLEPGVRQTRMTQATERVVKSAAQCREYLQTVNAGENWGKFLRIDDAQAVGGASGGGVPELFRVPERMRSEQLTEEQKQFTQKPAIVSYGQAVEEYVALAANGEAFADNDAVRASLRKLLESYALYRSNMTKVASGAVREAFDQLRLSAMDGGERMGAAMRSVAFNFNMRAVATEPFINRLVASCRAEQSLVDDVILEAKVDGCSMTVSQVHFDLLQSPCDARWDITAHGDVSSRTQGVKCIATIFTQGCHEFCARKLVIFNGDCFFTEPARISVNANTKTMGAKTKLSKIPLIGKMSEDIAIDKAKALRSESEAIARRKVAQKALPKMNYEIDQKFGPGGEVSCRYQRDVADRLSAEGLYPDLRVWSTTDYELLYKSRLMYAGELGGGTPPPYAYNVGSFGAQIHESLLNNSANKIGLQGKTYTQDQLREELNAWFSRVLNRDVSVEAPAKEEDDKTITFTFDELDPIRVRLDGGEIRVSMRAALQREGDEALPVQIITTRFRPSIENDKLVVEPGGVSVEPADGQGSPQQIGISVRIRDQLQKKMTRKEYERYREVEVENKMIPVYMTHIEVVDGWISILAE